jgi:hypothetical protein
MQSVREKGKRDTKRDLDLIRNLLIQVEDTNDNSEHRYGNPWRMFSSPGASAQDVKYHARLLLEQGLIRPESVKLDGQDEAGMPAAKFLPDALTDAGHEFLNSVRNPEVWRKTKDGANKVGSFGIDLIKDLAKGFLKTEIKKRTGLDAYSGPNWTLIPVETGHPFRSKLITDSGANWTAIPV